MKKALIGVGVVIALVIVFSVGSPKEDRAGGSINQTSELSNWSSNYTTIASASSKGTVNSGPARLFGVRVTSDSTSVRYFQLYNLATTSAGYWASKTPVASFAIVAAAASSSPTVVTLDNSLFSPALRFGTGLVWAISSSPTVYASASVVPARHTVNIFYESYLR